MYKFSNNLSNANLVLVRKKLGDGSCASLVVMRTQRRYAHNDSNKYPPGGKPKPPKSYKLLFGALGATMLTGGAVVYAKSNPEARNFLASNMPWANDFIALVYQENQSYGQFTVNQLSRATSTVKDFMFGKEGVSPIQKVPQMPPTKFEPLYVEPPPAIGTPEVTTPATLIKTEESVPEKPPVVKITKDMVQLEHEMHENTKIAVEAYKEATKHARNYTKALFNIVETSVGELDKTQFSKLQGAQQERDATIKRAKEASAKARCAIETLNRMIDSGSVQAPPDSVAQTLRFLRQFRKDLDSSMEAYNAERDKGILADTYWSKVQEARSAFKDELNILFPGADITARKLDLKGDTDLLLLYTLKQMQYLQNEIAEIQTVRDIKLSRAIECHDEKLLIDAKAEEIVKKERLERDKEFNKKTLEVQAEANRSMREQLKRQFEIQQEVLQDALNRKEKEVMSNFGRVVSEKLECERIQFKKDLASMAGKLKAIEQTLKQRAAAEAEARRSQSLWAAAEALLATTTKPGDQAKIDSELKALEKAGKDDRLVQTILKGIPEEIRCKGIVTEHSLRQKFDKLEKTAAKVALVGRDGAGLSVYFLSWLQSKILFTRYAEIPRDELNNLPTDFTKLDTFDIMQRARYHMDHGNLPSALRYINLLQGAPRAAARAWADAARAHLEVRQAAETVMAHASVAGLLYL